MAKRICVIIGHGGKDCGAINPTSKGTELAYNEKLAPRVADILTINGYNADIYNRGNRKSEDIKYLNRQYYDLIISLHCNSYNGIASGTEVLYWCKSKNGLRLAEDLQKEIVEVFQLPNRKVKPLQQGERGAYLVKDTNAPCVIIKPFFIDNDNDYHLGLERLESYANAIVKGINKYFE